MILLALITLMTQIYLQKSYDRECQDHLDIGTFSIFFSDYPFPSNVARDKEDGQEVCKEA